MLSLMHPPLFGIELNLSPATRINCSPTRRGTDCGAQTPKLSVRLSCFDQSINSSIVLAGWLFETVIVNGIAMTPEIGVKSLLSYGSDGSNSLPAIWGATQLLTKV